MAETERLTAPTLEQFAAAAEVNYLRTPFQRALDSPARFKGFQRLGVELAVVTRDDVGVHDMLLAPCSQAMFAKRGEFGHASCHANLTASLAPFGIAPHAIVATLNVFMDVRVDADGRVTIHPPPSRVGDRFELRAQRDLIVGITACASELTNAGQCKAIAYEVIAHNT